MKFWAIVFNDLKLAVRDRMFFFWLLIFPLLFAVIFGLAFPESTGKDQKIALDILDNDQNFLSRALIEELQGDKYVINVLEERKEMRVRLLLLPENFTSNVLNGKKVDLILEKKANSNIKASQAAYAHVLKAVVKILTKIVVLSGEEAETIEEKFDQFKWERIVNLQSSLGGKLKVIPAGFNHAIPAVIVMFILFTVLMYGGLNLLEERRNGQLERIFLSPVALSTLISSKWLSRLLLGMLQVSVLFL